MTFDEHLQREIDSLKEEGNVQEAAGNVILSGKIFALCAYLRNVQLRYTIYSNDVEVEYVKQTEG